MPIVVDSARPDAHTNFAYSTVATAPSPATTGTSLTVAAGTGVLYPTPPFNATVWPTAAQPVSTNAEIVRVTAVVGDVFTITRGQEATTARTVVVGDQVAATITAKTLTDAENDRAVKAAAVAFTDGDTVRRVTVTDTEVLASHMVAGSIRRPNTTDDSQDPGWIYHANVVEVVDGAFDVLVAATAWGFEDPSPLAPNETVQFVYQIG